MAYFGAEGFPNSYADKAKGLMEAARNSQPEVAAPDSAEFGVLYFVDENPAFRKMLNMSVRSLKRFHPDWPIKVVEIPSYHVPFWKKVYRSISYWKQAKRYNRACQDLRVIAAKAEVLLQTPFTHTLYLDVDTIVMKPLHKFRVQAMECDVIVTPLPWKTYFRMAKWQPKAWPYVMAGVLFYSKHFRETYQNYVNQFGSSISKMPSQEQYVLSLACHMEIQNLNIVKDPTLQIDVLNLPQHLGTSNYPRLDGCVDLSWKGLSRFHIFHYNEYKPQYMGQIMEVWGLSPDE